MADEFRISGSVRLENANDYFSKTFSYNSDQSSVGGGGPGVQVIGTTHETVAGDGVTSQGFAFFKNLDNTNFCDVGVDVAATFYPLMRIPPGESFLVKLSPSATIYAKADTASIRLDVSIFEA